MISSLCCFGKTVSAKTAYSTRSSPLNHARRPGSGAPPGRPFATVVQQNALRFERIPDAVGFRPVLARSRVVACLDLCLDGGGAQAVGGFGRRCGPLEIGFRVLLQ